MNAHREARPRAARHRARPSLETMEERLLLAATKLPAGLQGQLLRSVGTAPRTAPVVSGRGGVSLASSAPSERGQPCLAA